MKTLSNASAVNRLEVDIGVAFRLEELLVVGERATGRGVGLDGAHAEGAALRYLIAAVVERIAAEGSGRIPCPGARQWPSQRAELRDRNR